MVIDKVAVNDELLNMAKGWIAVYDSGDVVLESQKNWADIKKKGIKILALKWHNKVWKIENKTSYLCFKRGTVLLSPGMSTNEVECLERCIGYYDENGKKVIYRVNDGTGQMTITCS